MKYRVAALVVLAGAACAGLAYAQGTLAQAKLTGRVLDPSGAVIPKAAIELVEINKGVRYTTVANDDGYYNIDQIPFGTYKLTASFEGFGHTVLSPIDLTANQVANLDITLKPGTVVEQVSVQASALRLESQTSDIGQDLTKGVVADLPTAHRNPLELVGLVAGVTTNRTEGGNNMNTSNAVATWGRSNFTLGGGFRNTSGYMIDGVDASNSYSPGGMGTTVIIPPESVQEFRLNLFDNRADMPRGNGIVSLVSKSGTNDIHGLLLYNLQNSALNAADFFDNRNGVAKPLLQRNEPGGVVGGPVYIPKLYDGRNKTFFFFDFDEIRQPISTLFEARVPTSAELNGNFAGIYSTSGSPVIIYNPNDTYTDPVTGHILRRPFANNQIPAGMINQFAGKVAGYYPQPNVAGGLLTSTGQPTEQNNFITHSPAPFELKDWNLRVDEQVTPNHRFMGRTIHYPAPTQCQNPYGNVASPNNCISQNFTYSSLTYNWTAAPNLVMNASFYWTNSPFTLANGSSPSHQFDMSSLGGPYSPGPYLSLLQSNYSYQAFPQIGISGYGSMGAGSVRGGEATGGGMYALDFAHGRHSLKAGMQLYSRAVIVAYTTSTAGGYQPTGLSFSGSFTDGPDPLQPSPNTGNGLADMELGILGGGVVNLPSLERLDRSTYYGWYFMDDWRVTPKLTLNLGVRYDFELSTREAHGRVADMDATVPNPIGTYVGPNTNGQSLNQALGRTLMGAYVFAYSPLVHGSARPYGEDFTDIGPRIGFAYAMSPKMTIRGGFAKSYMPAINGVTDNGVCPSCTGVTSLVSSIDGIHPNPAVSLTNPYPNGINKPLGNSQGLLTGVGLPLTETGAAYPVSPYVWQFNIGGQRQLPSNSVLSVSYVANRGRRLPCPNDACDDQINMSSVQSYQSNLYNLVPNPFYGIITNPTSLMSQPRVQQGRLLLNWPQFVGGTIHMPAAQNQLGFPLFSQQYPFHSSWDALLVSFEKRFSNGLELMVAYTWSKNLSNVDGFESWMAATPVYQDMYNIESAKALSSEDVPQRLVIAHVYKLPIGRKEHFGTAMPRAANAVIGGWRLGGYLTYAKGTPLWVNVTPDNSGRFGTNESLYANVVGTPSMTQGSRNARITQWFNTAAFAAPAPFTLGNAPRTFGSIRSDSIKNYDMSLFKDIPLYKERWKLELRFDSFNLFNRPTMGIPNTTLGSSSFGEVTATSQSPRFLQVGARVMW